VNILRPAGSCVSWSVPLPLIAFIGVLWAGGCGSDSRPADPHALGRSLVQAIQSEDAEAYRRLIYTRDDVEYMLEHRTVAGRDPKTYRDGWERAFDRRRAEIERSFDRIYREGARQGLENWSGAVFKTVDFTSIQEGDFTRHEMIVKFTADGREYVLSNLTGWETENGLAIQSAPTLLTASARHGLGR